MQRADTSNIITDKITPTTTIKEASTTTNTPTLLQNAAATHTLITTDHFSQFVQGAYSHASNQVLKQTAFAAPIIGPYTAICVKAAQRELINRTLGNNNTSSQSRGL
jgi:hypothetical protein